jgi:hypothetical protein
MGKPCLRIRTTGKKNGISKVLFSKRYSPFYISLFFIFFFASGNTFGQKPHEKTFTTTNAIYERNIKTVLLYPGNDQLSPPIVPVQQSASLIMEFDELVTDFQNYYVKIIHCNADWTVSSLNPIQYMDDYNEFFINDRNISVGTRVLYIHYKFPLPGVKLSGNYLVKVYRDYNEDDLILTRRFMAYDNFVRVNPVVKFSADPGERNFSQQVDFNIDYSRYEIINPMQNVSVVLRQNHRWDKAISDLKPVVVNEDVKSLEYFYFNRENNFKGGNEFRVIDIRSSNFSGFNINKVRRDSNRSEAFVYVEKSRAAEAYTQPLIADFDGKYKIENYETGDSENMVDYMYVTFSFESEPVNGKIYVMGLMTDWKPEKSFEMIYNSVEKKYTCRVLLKQGIYNYKYALVNLQKGTSDENYFEGTHSLAQNNYDVIVYYRPFGSRNDLIIGYKNVNYLGRR